MSYNYSDPPTEHTLAEARRSLESTRSSVSELTSKIDAAEAALAQIVRDTQSVINGMQIQRALLEEEVARTMAYISPIRRLPVELLREIFLWEFEEYPCCGWIVAAVCRSWRRLALNMPQIWSKIRLLTSQQCSAETIRLWLERAGPSIPLDIEIFLRVTNSKASSPESRYSRARRYSPPSTPPDPAWGLPHQPHHVNVNPAHYVLPHPAPAPAPAPAQTLPVLPPAHTPVIVSSYLGHDGWPHPSIDRGASNSSIGMHWGHVAIYYLVEQMHRWERFVFRFDKQFNSIGALKSINGDAPLLREFEVSSAEAALYPEWPWLPNAPADAPISLPKLQTLTLQYMPFKWTSPMLRANLRTLNLRTLPASHLPLDRIGAIISESPLLENLSLHFSNVLPAILPLKPIPLPHITTLSVGGHYLLNQFVEHLALPALESLTLDIEARDAIEDTISALLARSNTPPLAHLSLAYGAPGAAGAAASASSFYYSPGGMVITWSVLLVDLPFLKEMHVGGTAIDPLLSALGPPDEDMNPVVGWACPRLEVLRMRSCHAHSEGVGRLVQMVQARNPESASSGGGGGAGGGGGGGGAGAAVVGGVSPVKLKALELHECTTLGPDVLKWLKGRIEEVVCTEPVYERPSISHPYL